MASQSVRTDSNVRRVRPADRGHANGRQLRYQLDVATTNAADAVRYAGGWLFDRAMAGWEVNVAVAHPDGIRALEILGARTADLSSLLTALADRQEQAAGLAVDPELLASHDEVRRCVAASMRTGLTEVACWGPSRPELLSAAVDSVQYRLSAAAMIFKRHALAAAGIDDEVGPTESLVRGGYRPLDSDLVPVD